MKMSVSTILHTFKEKIEDAAAMVQNMNAENKLQAVEYWNLVSEQLQIIVNHSAENMGAFALQMDSDKVPDFIDASHLVALGLAPTFLTNFSTSDSLADATEVLSEHASNQDVHSQDDVAACPIQNDHNQPLQPEGNLSCNVSETPVIAESIDIDADFVDTAVALEEEVAQPPEIPNTLIQDNENPIQLSHNEVIQPPVEPEVTKSKSSETRHPSKPKGKSKNGTTIEDSNGTRYYQCSFCERIFFTPSQLTTHTWTHTKPYVCATCHARFSTKANLVVHNRRHSGERPFVCMLCQACFSTKGNLLRHRKAHTGEKPWQCSVCSSRFTEKKSLKVHMRRHTGERPYGCTICPKSFTQAGILQTHLATHLDQRAFPCHLCGKSFRQKSQLRLHQQRHAGLRKYECSTCPSKFLTKGDMERHKRVHTGERPFTCKLCQKSFTRQQSLNEHMNRHYGLKPYQCKYCEKGYVEMSACYKHIKTHERASATIAIKEKIIIPNTEETVALHKDNQELPATETVSLSAMVVQEIPKTGDITPVNSENIDFASMGILTPVSSFQQDQF